MTLIYTTLKLATSCYFSLLSFAFWLWNFFQVRRLVDKPTNELLLISAGEAAAMIRRGEVCRHLINKLLHLHIYWHIGCIIQFQISSLQLVDAYIDRIRHVNGLLNAVVTDNFQAARNLALKTDNYLSLIDKNTEEFAKVSSGSFLSIFP